MTRTSPKFDINNLRGFQVIHWQARGPGQARGYHLTKGLILDWRTSLLSMIKPPPLVKAISGSTRHPLGRPEAYAEEPLVTWSIGPGSR